MNCRFQCPIRVCKASLSDQSCTWSRNSDVLSVEQNSVTPAVTYPHILRYCTQHRRVHMKYVPADGSVSSSINRYTPRQSPSLALPSVLQDRTCRSRRALRLSNMEMIRVTIARATPTAIYLNVKLVKPAMEHQSETHTTCLPARTLMFPDAARQHTVHTSDGTVSVPSPCGA